MNIALNKPDRLSLFALLWAIANLYHSLSAPGALTKPLAFLTFLFALILVFRPRSVIIFMLMIAFAIGKVFRTIPFSSNHMILDMAINIGILATFLFTLIPCFIKDGISQSIKNLDREKLFDTFAPMARVSLLLLYFFAVLHKLNWDYLNPTISCATWYLSVFRDNGITIIPDNHFVQMLSVYGSIITEAGIPLLLLFRRTRTWGILLGLGFHFILSLDPHEGMFSFVVQLYSLYFLFTPVDFPEKLYLVITGILKGKGEYLKVFMPLIFVAVITVLLILSVANYPHPIKYIPFAAWYLWGMLVIVIYLTVIWTQDFSNTPSTDFFLIKKKGLLLIPVLLIINGLSPYLGLKTQLSFSMFSNLRTEGGETNHLFIPTSFQLTSWQQDLVEIKDTNLEDLGAFTQNNRLLTFFELRRIVSKVPRGKDFFVNYVRNQKSYTLTVENDISNDPEVSTPHPWALAKFVRFRSVDKGPCTCKH